MKRIDAVSKAIENVDFFWCDLVTAMRRNNCQVRIKNDCIEVESIVTDEDDNKHKQLLSYENSDFEIN